MAPWYVLESSRCQGRQIGTLLDVVKHRIGRGTSAPISRQPPPRMEDRAEGGRYDLPKIPSYISIAEMSGNEIQGDSHGVHLPRAEPHV